MKNIIFKTAFSFTLFFFLSSFLLIPLYSTTLSNEAPDGPQTMLSPESRFSPYFEKQGLGIDDTGRVLSALARLYAINSGKIEGDFETEIAALNELLKPSNIEIVPAMHTFTFQNSKRTVPYFIFNFKQQGKQINALLIDDYGTLSPEELTEIGISEEEKNQLNFPGFEGVWFTHYNLVNLEEAIQTCDKVETLLDSGATTSENAAQFLHSLSVHNSVTPLPSQKKNHQALLVRKSKLARKVAELAIKESATDLISTIKTRAYADMTAYLQNKVNRGEVSQDWADSNFNTAKVFIEEWLDPANSIPEHIRIGLIRGMLEGRTEDILFAYSSGWRKFGTAGIRNPAIMSVFDPVKYLEMEEFVEDPYAPILTGPNMINSITLLQQEAAIVRLFKHLQATADDASADLAPEFIKNINEGKITIAYDSRLNGKHFADLLAAAFLRDGIKVELFDNASGMPSLVYAANRRGSAFGFLISASHSEAWFNGFKAVLGHLASQVDASSKDMILEQRKNVEYTDMASDLALPGVDFEKELREKAENLTWLGSESRRNDMDYLGAAFEEFYPEYYEHVKRRSPIALLPLEVRLQVHEQRELTKLLYTAFFGVGAVPAGNFSGFLQRTGYSEVDIVEAQTTVMDGRFPGHHSPDPGIVAGWLVNLVDYLKQHNLVAGAREELSQDAGIEIAGLGRIATIDNVSLEGKRVVDRVDFNVPVRVEFNDEGDVIDESIEITDARRIEKELPTLLAILKQNPKYVTLVMHFEPKIPVPGESKPKKIALSTRVIAEKLKDLLPAEYKDKVVFLTESVTADGVSEQAIETISQAKDGQIFVMENSRLANGEKKGDEDLRNQFSSLADTYVVDAFGAVHRPHASMMPTGSTEKVVGHLVEDEVRNLSKAFSPTHPMAAIFGGAKVEDKVDMINNFIESMTAGDSILIGGAMAYTFLKAQNPTIELGNSLIQEDKIAVAAEILKKAQAKGIDIVLPVDHIAAEKLGTDATSEKISGTQIKDGFMGVDIGDKSQALFVYKLSTAKTVVWNGPVGVFEDKNGGFIEGTAAVAQKLEELADAGKTDVIIGGGDTATAIKATGVSRANMFVSTGGGASFDFLSNKGNLAVLANLARTSTLDAAIETFNDIELSVATDPDIDRAGIMLSLPQGSSGNIKAQLIASVTKYIQEADTEEIPDEVKSELIAIVTSKLEKGLQDKLLLTANEAWTFLMFYRLKIMEEKGMLSKDKLYIIEKSHVTTSGLGRVAELYRKKGYHVYVVDTYVGFTELAKKSRDLFAIADLAWKTKDVLSNSDELAKQIEKLELANTVLKNNVPAVGAGVPFIDVTIKLLKSIQKGNTALISQAGKYLEIIAHTDVLAGVEESNGYGEFGRWNPEEAVVEGEHISEKDGSLAAFIFSELSSYGKLAGKSSYDMFVDMNREIGQVFTVNSALYHPGFTGNKEKEDEVEGLEKVFAVELQKKIDRGEEVRLFNGKYKVKEVLIYRDEKYDDIYLGFPEEGIRLILETPRGSFAICTYRPSGTGDSIRDYNWIMGILPKPGEDMEAYRQQTEEEMQEMVRDFFGIDNVRTGYADLSSEEFFGLLTALNEAGVQNQQTIFNKAAGEDLSLTDAEKALLAVVMDFAYKARDKGPGGEELETARAANRSAWKTYLATTEAKEYPKKINFSVNGLVVASIPKALVMGLQAGLVDYLISLVEATGETTVTIACNDDEIAEKVFSRSPDTIKVVISEPKQDDSAAKDPGELLDSSELDILEGKGRQVISDDQITEFLATSPVARGAQADFDESLYNDPQSSGYIAPAELGDRSPRYGPTMDTAIEVMEGFAQKHMGKNHLNYSDPVTVFGVGIGGQSACSYQSVGIRNPHPNRKMIPLDSLAVNYEAYIVETVDGLRNSFSGYADLLPEDIIAKFLAFEEPLKVLMIAGSKSGTTDETMTNFQQAVKAMIQIVFRTVYDDSTGKELANNMIAKIYDGNDWFDPENDIINKLDETEKDVFSIVLNRIIVATGEWDDEQQKGSRFDRLKKLFAQKDPRYALTAVWMATNLGGRFQGISPNGFLYNLLMGYDINKQLEAGREVAKSQLMGGDANQSKRLAALVRLAGANKVMIAIPNKSIYGKFQKGLGQIIPESLGKGKIAGHEVGLQTYAYSLQDMVSSFQNVADEKGSRVYFLISDPLMSNEDKAAEEQIIAQQRKKGNLVVRFTLKDQSEAELSKLLQFIEDFTVWYGFLNTADAILRPAELGITVPESAREKLNLNDINASLEAYNPAKHSLEKIITGKGELSDEEKLLKWVRDLYAPHLQPDVEAAKLLLKGTRKNYTDGIAFTLFNPEAQMTDDGLPLRDENIRTAWYKDRLERVKNGPRISEDSIFIGEGDTYRNEAPSSENLAEVPTQDISNERIKTTLDLLRQQIIAETQYDRDRQEVQSTEEYRKESDKAHEAIINLLKKLKSETQSSNEFEETARQLAALMLHARSQGKSINLTVYEEVGINLDVLQRFAHFLGIERLDFGPGEQHISKQLSAGGINIGLEIIATPAKTLSKIQSTELSKIVRDGCVPTYLHGLFSYEEMMGFATAYDRTFENRKIEKALIETGDLTEDETLIDFLKMLARAQAIFESSITPKPDPVLAEAVNKDTEASAERLVNMNRKAAEELVTGELISTEGLTVVSRNATGEPVKETRLDIQLYSERGGLSESLSTADPAKAADIMAATLALMRVEKTMENMFETMLKNGEVPVFDGNMITAEDITTLKSLAEKTQSPIVVLNVPAELVIQSNFLVFVDGKDSKLILQNLAQSLAPFGLRVQDAVALVSQENFNTDTGWNEELLGNFYRWAVLPKGASMWDAVNAAYVLFNGSYDQILDLYTQIFEGDQDAAVAFMRENGFSKEALTESKGVDPMFYQNLNSVSDALKAQRAIAIAA